MRPPTASALRGSALRICAFFALQHSCSFCVSSDIILVQRLMREQFVICSAASKSTAQRPAADREQF